MTTAVTNTEDVGMTATAMYEKGEDISLMDTRNELMFHRLSSIHRLHHRASISFCHTSIFVSNVIVLSRQSGAQSELNRAVASIEVVVTEVEKSEVDYPHVYKGAMAGPAFN